MQREPGTTRQTLIQEKKETFAKLLDLRLSSRHALLAVPLLAPLPAAADWPAEVLLGTAYNFDSRLRLDQQGFAPIDFDASYRTRPFHKALYYAVRTSRRSADSAWELSLIHHKPYLRNPPPGVADFSISHGHNLSCSSWQPPWRRTAALPAMPLLRKHAGRAPTPAASSARS